MSITHEAYLNIVPGDSPAPIIKVSQYDADFSIVFHLIAKKRGIIPAYPRTVENDEDVTINVPTSATVSVRGTKTDGNGYSAAATLSGTATAPIVTVAGHEQMTASAGVNVYEITFYADNATKRLSTANFILFVEPAALDAKTITSESLMLELNDLIASVPNAVAAAERAEEAAAQFEIDATLTQQGRPADAKAVGDALNNLDVDATLTLQGKPADAKKVGDEISDIKADLSESVSDLKSALKMETKNIVSDYDSEMWEKGGLNNGQDDNYRQACRIRTKQFYTFQRGIKLKALTSTTKISGHINGETIPWSADITVEPNQTVRLFVEGAWDAATPPEMSVDDILSTVQITPIIPSLSSVKKTTDTLTAMNESIDMLTGAVTAITTGNYGRELFEKGSIISNGADDSYRTACRVRFKDFYAMPMGIKIRTNSTSTKIYAVIDVDGVETVTGWKTGLVIQPMQRVRLCIDCDWSNTSPEQKTVDEVLANVTITTVIEPLPRGIPDYYFEDNYLSDKVSDILSTSPEDGLMFAFITDFHISDNQKQSPKLLKYLKEQTNSVPFVIFGGDVLVSTVGEGIDVMDDAREWQSIMSYIGKDSIYQAQGNHDYLGFHYVNGERVIYNAPWSVCRQLIMGNLTDVVWCPGKIAYYFDVPIANTRIIVCNDYDTDYNKPDFTGGVAFSNEQRAWVVNVALSDDTKRVIFVSHQTYDPNMSGEHGEHQDRFIGMQSLFKAIVNKTYYSYGATTKDFTNSNIVFVAHFAGHRHADESNVDDGVLTICTTCDAIYDTTNRTPGTVTEQAFDVVAIDYNARTIKTTRIGYGDDRTFSF